MRSARKAASELDVAPPAPMLPPTVAPPVFGLVPPLPVTFPPVPVLPLAPALPPVLVEPPVVVAPPTAASASLVAWVVWVVNSPPHAVIASAEMVPSQQVRRV